MFLYHLQSIAAHTIKSYRIYFRDYLRKVTSFRRHCNVFYMNVVSQLCFADNIPPAKEVVERLLNYTVQTTRETLTTLDILRKKNFESDAACIEFNQMLRFFLLQILLQNR